MRLLKRSIPVAGLVGILGFVGIVMYMRPAEAQGPENGLAVRIVNPLPVPTTGSVGITGTPTVNISASSGPLAVRNIDEPGRMPFQQSIIASGGDPVLPHIPAGKRLIIKSVSYQIIAGRGTPGYMRMLITTSSPVMDYAVPFLFVGNRPGVGNFYVANAELTAFADPTSTVQFLSDNGFGAASFVQATVTGYLVDCSASNPCAAIVP